MFKVRVYDWSKGMLEVIESHWHNQHHAVAHAHTHNTTVKVYNPQGELIHTQGENFITYA